MKLWVFCIGSGGSLHSNCATSQGWDLIRPAPILFTDCLSLLLFSSIKSCCLHEGKALQGLWLFLCRRQARRDSPVAKPVLFFLFLEYVLQCLRSGWKSMGQHRRVCKVFLSSERRGVGMENIFFIQLKFRFLLFFDFFLHSSCDASSSESSCLQS